MASSARSTTPSEPDLILSSNKLADLDETTAQTIQSIANLTHAQRATLAVLFDLDGASASEVESRTQFTYHSANKAFPILEEEGLATIQDGRPRIAVPTNDAIQAADALGVEFDFRFNSYLREEQEQEDEDEAGTETVEATGGTPDSSSSSSTSNSAASSSSSSSKPQGFADRPAASWDEEAPDVSEGDVGPDLLELSAEMLSKAKQPRMSNLEREHVRAEQAMAAALLKMAADD